eukprot:474932-Pleurochrysis_carterae.AAC.1
MAGKSRGQPQEAGTCTATVTEVAAAAASSVSVASAEPAAAAVLADGNRGQPPAQINIRARGDAVADGDNDDDDDDDDDDATPALSPAGRHVATYELKCIPLRQVIDAQRNTIINLDTEIINLDKKTVRALQERCYVSQEAAAQQEVATAAAEEARMSYESNIKQVQAAANVKYKALLTKLQEERDASSDMVSGLKANITELQRMLNRANAAARAANKENAAA